MNLMISGDWKIQETGNYKGGLRDGNWYFMIVLDGGVRVHVAEGQYYKGKKVGHWTYYVPDLKRMRCDVCAYGEYDDDLKVGRWKYLNMQYQYFDRMKIRGYYLKNYPQELEHKPWTKYVEEYYPNGNIQEFGYSDNDGHKVGEWLYFYQNKNLKHNYWKNKKYFHPEGLRAMQDRSGQLLPEFKKWNRKRVTINLTKVSRFSKNCR